MNKQPNRDGAAVIWVGAAAGGTAVSAMAAQGRAWEWVEGEKKIKVPAGRHPPGKCPLLRREGDGQGACGGPKVTPPPALRAFSGSMRCGGDFFVPKKERLTTA